MHTEFVPLVCPSCGGELMIAANLEKAVCNYCGKPFIVRERTEQSNSVNPEHLLALARAACESGNFTEAYAFFSKTLELEPDSSEAWYGKGSSTCALSNPSLPRLVEAESYFREALLHCKNGLRPQLIIRIDSCLAIAYATHIIACTNDFSQLFHQAVNNIELYNSQRDIFDERWPLLLEQVMPAFTRFDSLLPLLTINKHLCEVLKSLVEACNFLIEGIPRQFVPSWDGPLTTWFPVTWFKPSDGFAAVLNARIKSYSGLMKEAEQAAP